MILPIISIIVPVYNSEAYLTECIESVLNQTFTDFELILINDGSKDSSGLICDSYARTDHRVRVIHKTNEGVSAARNEGINLAKGEWILFIDSDDWIDRDYIYHFMNQNPNIEESSLYIQSILKVEDGSISEFYSFQNKKKRLKNIFLENEIYVFGAPYCKLYNKDLIIKNKLTFPDNISFGEDTLFYLNYLQYVDNITTLSHQGYYYRLYSNESLSRKTHSIDKQMFYLVAHFCSVQRLIEQKGVEREKVFERLGEFYIWGLFIAWISQYRLKLDDIAISKHALIYSNEIKSILLRVKPQSIKSCIAKTLLMNILFLSKISGVNKFFRILYK